MKLPKLIFIVLIAISTFSKADIKHDRLLYEAYIEIGGSAGEVCASWSIIGNPNRAACDNFKMFTIKIERLIKPYEESGKLKEFFAPLSSDYMTQFYKKRFFKAESQLKTLNAR